MEDRGPPAEPCHWGHSAGGKRICLAGSGGGSEPGQGGPDAWTRWVLEDPEPLTQPELTPMLGLVPIKVPQGTLPALLRLPWLTAACRGPWSTCSLASFLPLWACPPGLCLSTECLLSTPAPPLHAPAGVAGPG